MIDIYCERTGPEFWSEPVNAITNLSFLMAFLVALPLFRRHWPILSAANRTVSVLLLALLLAICLGSSAFHTMATKAAMMADVIPITLFQLVFLSAYMRLGMGWPTLKVSFAMVAFFALGAVSSALPLPLNGSQSYLAPLVLLTVLAVFHKQQSVSCSNALWLAVGCFCVSLTLRTLDESVCPVWPLGLHFMWHVINGVVLYLCLKAYLARVTGENYQPASQQ